jgi:hypothetical protein
MTDSNQYTTGTTADDRIDGDTPISNTNNMNENSIDKDIKLEDLYNGNYDLNAINILQLIYKRAHMELLLNTNDFKMLSSSATTTTTTNNIENNYNEKDIVKYSKLTAKLLYMYRDYYVNSQNNDINSSDEVNMVTNDLQV